MGEQTAISWADHTFNPWTGCARVSPGCANCYAENWAKRSGLLEWGINGTRRVTSDTYWRQPLKWNRDAEQAGRPALVFCASLADVFEDRAELDEPRGHLFEIIGNTPHLIWQLLTKRPENVMGMVPYGDTASTWPKNVWIGTTVEDQQRADERIPHLLDIPAAVRFLSREPLLGPVGLTRPGWLVPPAIVCGETPPTTATRTAINTVLRIAAERLGARHIDWVIAGGESGPGHRPMNIDHARALRDQCSAAGVPFLFKQHGGQRPTSGGHLLDGIAHHDFPTDAQR